jgi:hypothetical protein
MMSEDKITITKGRYETLQRAYKLILALKDCGVDNWEGYAEAYNLAFPNEEEEEDDG